MQMDWLTLIEIAGMLFTFYLVFLLLKVLRESIKQSNEGKVSERCPLD